MQFLNKSSIGLIQFPTLGRILQKHKNRLFVFFIGEDSFEKSVTRNQNTWLSVKKSGGNVESQSC